MTGIKHGFEDQIVEVPLDSIRPSTAMLQRVLSTPKFRTILSSIRELGVIEPLAVFRSEREGEYHLLDGRLRLEALKALKRETAPCMISLDDEAYTFNRHINRSTAVHDHRMIRAALAKGASEERIAAVLQIDIKRVREKIHLLDGIAPEAASLLKDRMVIPRVFTILKRMKPMRQIEAAEMMIAANRFTASYAGMLLATTRPEALAESARPKAMDSISQEDLARMEKEMERLNQDSQAAEESVGDTMLSLVVAKGFTTRLLRNEAIHEHLKRHHADLLTTLNATIDAIAADSRTSERE
ncbi:MULTISPECIES: plasmid partitioning protein RepB C-terminal domain-containing protein [unclassified Caballeronia]|uniref:ParB/RepB/Spo0J family partition protein n=1 Tax=unclassified Caballeronia TaxID=2646786 RepID=UPI002028A401|nr:MULTISPECIES: plasmid partitioning protein RepB C-terminal domain-containing protein [unclassified Caballeronia]